MEVRRSNKRRGRKETKEPHLHSARSQADLNLVAIVGRRGASNSTAMPNTMPD